MQISKSPNSKSNWWTGIDSFTNLAELVIFFRVAKAALINFWAGAFFLDEISWHQTDLPLVSLRLILLCHLDSLGLSIGKASIFIESSSYFVISSIYLITSAVSTAGVLFHLAKTSVNPWRLTGFAKNFQFEWSDSRKLEIILG